MLEILVPCKNDEKESVCAREEGPGGTGVWRTGQDVAAHRFVRYVDKSIRRATALWCASHAHPHARVRFTAVGDAPISYARWRVVEDSCSRFAVIERWCTLKRHRNKKFASRLLKRAVKDISSQQSSLSAIVTPCPSSDRGARRLIESLGFSKVGEPQENRRGVYQRFILSRPFSLSAWKCCPRW